MRAVCLRCGAFKKRPMSPCPACAHRPDHEERAISYLLSNHHLDDADLARAAGRIRAGEPVAPARPLIDVVRAQLTATRALPEDEDIDLGLNREALFLLFLANLLFSPLVGLAAWWGWRIERPVASRQALGVTLPVAAVFFVGWGLVMWF